jgi:hypothetical protein
MSYKKYAKGIMMKACVPHMVKLHPKQTQWLDWVYTTGDGRKFLDWCAFNDDTKEALGEIWIFEEYDKANDSGILNDIIGLYREWSYDTRIKWK